MMYLVVCVSVYTKKIKKNERDKNCRHVKSVDILFEI